MAHLIGTAGTAQLGIAGQRCQHVSRHVDLGNHGDVALLGIGHDVARLLLCVVAAVRRLVVQVGIGAHHGARSLRADGGELGIAFDLDAPALIVGQVPVKHVHVVQRQQVDEFLDEVHPPEVSRAVQVHAAIAESWCVGDHGSG